LRSTGQQPGAAAALAMASSVLEGDLEETGTFVTLFHGRLCAEDGTLAYADAGHGLTLVVRADGRAERLGAAGMPLGAWPGSTWEQQSVTLGAGDTLVCVSDGVLDLYDGTLGALEQVADLVRRSRDPQQVVSRITALSRRQELADDVTALVVRRREGS
jgi:serine phosphatase RsbU (regulator of sigma subunit)